MPSQNLPGLMIDRAHPLARGLAGWWPMNEVAGERVLDISGNGNHGLMVGFSPSTTSGRLGGSNGVPGGGGRIIFDAENDGISVPHSKSLAILGDITMCSWVKSPVTNYVAIFQKGDSYGTAGPYSCDIRDSEGTAKILISRGDATVGESSYFFVPPFARNTWQFVAVQMKGAEISCWLNGTKTDTATYGGFTILDIGTPLYIGRRGDGLYGVKELAHARIYNRALSASEMAQLYVDPLAGALAPSRATRYYKPAAAPAAPAGSKGRRLVRWLIDIPMIPNPLGEYVWRREEEDEIFILFGG